MSQEIVNHLITLKFNIEKEINTLKDNENFLKELKLMPPKYNQNFCTITRQYTQNIKSYGNLHIEMQMELLNEINKQLKILCKHEWIDDVIDESNGSRNYCYCQLCFLKKN